jgi:cytochrome c peroxidase
MGAFKTPTLREVGRTSPYMHDGSLGTLEEVVAFYSRGGRPNPNLDPDMQPLGFSSDDQRALVAFLRTLTAADR